MFRLSAFDNSMTHIAVVHPILKTLPPVMLAQCRLGCFPVNLEGHLRWETVRLIAYGLTDVNAHGLTVEARRRAAVSSVHCSDRV